MNKKKETVEKTCFVIMPISDLDGYDIGHFSRVYDHLIKPACEMSGYKPVRADEVASSNYIVIDILSKIVDSDLVLCDLSGRNPNVLYELGIRQAFNLPTVLIKDVQTDKIFDIQGLRYTEYSNSLRIDSVEKQISSISKSIDETIGAKGKDINSLIQLLGIKAAAMPSQIEVSDETSVVLAAIKDLSRRMMSLEKPSKISAYDRFSVGRKAAKIPSEGVLRVNDKTYYINGFPAKIGEDMFVDGDLRGKLLGAAPNTVSLEKDGLMHTIISEDPEFLKINSVPF